jgi:hypothetical protein
LDAEKARIGLEIEILCALARAVWVSQVFRQFWNGQPGPWFLPATLIDSYHVLSVTYMVNPDGKDSIQPTPSQSEKFAFGHSPHGPGGGRQRKRKENPELFGERIPQLDGEGYPRCH